jgi:beta-glucosidase
MLFRAKEIALLIIMSTGIQAAPPEVDQRIQALMSRMTLEEKLGQMSQSTSMSSPISAQIQDQIRKGRWGSFLNAGSPKDRAIAQRIAVEESRLHIPLLFGRDVIHGYRTIFPIPLGQSTSWNPQLVEQAARVAAREASGEGIHWAFAPMIDIVRDPRWGRVAESFGEDPYLTGALGAAVVRGFQGQSLSDPASVAACAKHYVGYGAAEAGREYNTTWIPEILLREVYLRPFRSATDAGVATIMTAFNALNGVPASGNRFTIQQILRDEWKFSGLVVSDYESITEMVRHGYARDARDAAREALSASVDMEMVSTSYFDHLKSLVESGEISLPMIDAAVRRILELKFRLGLFDQRAQSTTPAQPAQESREVARRLATESAVLLKNNGNVLPIGGANTKVAVIGPLADSPVDQMGTWVMDARTEDVETPLTSLRRALGNSHVIYAKAMANSRDIRHDGFAEALAAARQADVVLLFLGEEQILSGEAHSRAFLDLPGAQEALVEEIAKAGKPMVGILQAGRPMTFHNAAARLNAVLYAWHPGTVGGPAIADLLLGRANPSGKLTMTFPRTVGQVPIYYNHLNTGRPASTGELGIPLGNPVNPTGYTSKYVDVDFTPEYPFGYGLSYTRFEYSGMRLSTNRLRMGATLEVSAEVRNSGSREGDEVVQLYVRDLVGSVARPVRELKGFRRVHLKAGEKQTVHFSLSTADLAFYNDRMQLVTEPGDFQVWIAPDSASGVEGAFRVE